MRFQTCIAIVCLLLVNTSRGAQSQRMLLQNRRGPRGSRIGGGTSVRHRVEFMASLRDPNGSHYCGGTLIAENVVLTAAHCIINQTDPLQRVYKPQVHIGRLEREGPDSFSSFETVKAIIHPRYNKTSRLDYDVALLVLDSDAKRKPIRLATTEVCFRSTDGCPVRLLGWGRTEVTGNYASTLQEASTTSVNRAVCRRRHTIATVTESMICAGEMKGGIDSCLGDSGGPMILKGRQVGIVSWGEGCGVPKKPGVYTSIPKALPWIQEELGKLAGSGVPGSLVPGSHPDPCDCTYTGVSGGVSTGRKGCKAHLLDSGDRGTFCMVNVGVTCSSATPSIDFTGAAWKNCSLRDPCLCADDGVSGGVNTSRRGCSQHLLSEGDTGRFCMVQGGMQCKSATASTRFPGAAWKDCA